MGLLFSKLDERAKKIGVATKDRDTFYATGIDAFDWKNAQYNDLDGEYNFGLSAGSLNIVIGRSGSGKTSFVIQAASNIVSQFDEGTVLHFDFEHSTTKQRAFAMSGLSKDEFAKKYKFYNSGITNESLYKFIVALAEIKEENRDKLMYDTGRVDDDGEPVMEFQPTVVIIDSIATMSSDNNAEADEMGGQMNSTAQAKSNNTFIKRIMGNSTMADYNIMIIAINHITTKIDINPMAKTPSEINYLRQGESMTGGTSFPYMASTLIRIDPGTKLDPDSNNSANNRYGIKGFVAKITMIKSRTAPAGVEFNLVYDQVNGFSNGLTNFSNMVEAGVVQGKMTYEIPGYDRKVRFKEVNALYNEDPEFRKALDEASRESYKQDVKLAIRKINKEFSNEDSSEDVIEDDNIRLINGVKMELVFEDEEGSVWKPLGTSNDDTTFYDDEGNEVDIEL